MVIFNIVCKHSAELDLEKVFVLKEHKIFKRDWPKYAAKAKNARTRDQEFAIGLDKMNNVDVHSVGEVAAFQNTSGMAHLKAEYQKLVGNN